MPPARPLPPTEFPPTESPLTESLRRWSTERGAQRAFTFVDFPTPDSPGRHRSLTWKRLDQQARTIAWRLRADVGPGERAALMLPQGLGYVAAFLGCLYAGVIAVPLFSPDLPGHAGRLAAVLDDCEPSCILTDTPTAPAIAAFAAEHGIPHLPVVRIDRPAGAGPLTDAFPDPDRPLPVLELDDIAYLQYTSGSTRVPAGVMISHGNVVANARQAVAAFGVTADGSTSVGWLPLFHDMGLVLSIAAPVLAGMSSVLMDPVSFLERPVRWLRLLGAYPGTISAAPNFAYDYCATRIDEEQTAALRLDRVSVMINGSEPVRQGTIERFQRAFDRTGLPPEAHCPSYGLAEATVFVTTEPPADLPRTLVCDREALAAGHIRPCADDDALATVLVGCGTPVGQELRITDPVTGLVLPEDRIGEIRLRGPNIGLGYWKRTGRSQASFASRIPGELGDWLRTGDLGALHEGRLQVTGRLKDLLIVDGRNHYPQDLEETVQSSLDCVRRDRLALFTVTGDGRPDEVVAVAEHARDLDVTAELCAAAERAARARISARHGVRLARLLLVPPGAVPRTSSGKVSRSACRERYLAGEYEREAAAGE